MRPSACGEPVWEDEEEPTPLMLGTATPAPDPEPAGPAAVIWLPDPEQRHGWREYYVSKVPKETARRPLGFQPRNKE